ncbi:MAG: hypothetical protein ACRBBR_14260 [Cellvibrionaceae bacterium]
MKIKMRAWHCYYYLMFGFFLLHCVLYVGAMILFKEFAIDLLAFILIEALLVMGLYGFIKKKPIYKQWLWQVATVIGLLALCYQLYEMRVPQWFGQDIINYIPALLMFLFLAPWLYGLVRYGFVNREIWKKAA